jgi:DNA invertase Pin-like site-specific DNA recombinase
MLIGYARVSTEDQNLDLQRDALSAAGCGAVFEDHGISGAVNGNGRKGLTDALAACGAGDVLVVWKLDRLGRSLLDLVELVERLKGQGTGLKVLAGHGASVDTTTANGRLVLGIFAALAEFERELIRERTKAGMRAARRRGRHVGRPRRLDAAQLDHARALIASGKGKGTVAALLGVHVSTLRRALNTDLLRAGPVRYPTPP